MQEITKVAVKTLLEDPNARHEPLFWLAYAVATLRSVLVELEGDSTACVEVDEFLFLLPERYTEAMQDMFKSIEWLQKEEDDELAEG